MKKSLILIFILIGMTSIAHAASCPTGQFADTATICWPTQAQADAASASYTAANELAPAPARQAASNAGTPAASEGFTALAPIPGLTSSEVTSAINATSLANFFNNLYKYLIGLAATLAVIEIIWGGLEISTKDSVSKQSNGRERITQAIFGLVLVLSPVLVFSIINPNILNLSLDLPKLDTVSTPQPVATPCTSLDCTKSVTAGYIVQSGTEFYPCDGNSCSAEITKCQNKSAGFGFDAVDTVVCTKSGNIVDPAGLITTGAVIKDYSCISGETLQVSCSQMTSQIPGGGG
ncbi:MAG TPA: pilin [Candidatus Paceibacterota bacterium]|nr:pilin [Candidatus Paceibacterota bacterium]